MKVTIKKIVFDTKKAHKVGSYSNQYACCQEGDEHRIVEILYHGENGYFLVAKGGALTKYAGVTDAGWVTAGSDVIALTKDQARKWVKRYLGLSGYDKEFGEEDSCEKS